MDVLRYHDKVAVVTGAGNGLGRAHALELARRGARVVVNDLGGSKDGNGSGHSAADRVVDEIVRHGGEAVASYDSVATRAGGEAICAVGIERWGRLDAVIANAGILRDRSFAKLSEEELRAVLAVHLEGAFFTLAPAFRWMKEHGGGRLVATTSASGLFGNFGQANYAAAKLGVVGLVQSIAIEGARFGIKANAIAPIAATRLTSADESQLESADLGVMDPARVSPLVALLAHDECPVSGEVFVGGGGWYARAFVGVTQGWHPDGGMATAEDLLANLDRVRSPEMFTEPEDANAIAAHLAIS